jgi:plasmid stabilization system protein ParE
VGSGKSWPVGIEEAADFDKCALVEGAPDFLALHTFMWGEERQDIAPLGVLGAASHRLAPEALAKLRGKLVCLYPHADEAGVAAAKAWARALRDAGAKVTAFDLSGIVRADGRPGKDLADVCCIDYDCFERERKFWSVLP